MSKSRVPKWDALALIFAVLFVLTTPLCVLTFNSARVIFDAPLVKRVLTKQVVESDLVPAALEWFSVTYSEEREKQGKAGTAIEEPDVIKAIQYQKLDHWRKIRTEALPNDLIVGWLSTTLDGFYEWIDNNDPLPNISLDFKPWKNFVRGAHARNVGLIIYSALPPCRQAEIDDFVHRLKTGQATTKTGEVLYNLFTPCAYPNPWLPDQRKDYQDGVEESVRDIPDIFSVTKELARIEKEQGVSMDFIKLELRVLRLTACLAALVPVGLIVLILAVGVRSLRDFGRWIGLPLLITGLLVLISDLVFQFGITAVLLAGPLRAAPNAAQTEMARVASILVNEIFVPVLIQSAVFIVLGLIIAVIGSLAKRKQSAPERVRQ